MQKIITVSVPKEYKERVEKALSTIPKRMVSTHICKLILGSRNRYKARDGKSLVDSFAELQNQVNLIVTDYRGGRDVILDLVELQEFINNKLSSEIKGDEDQS